MVTLLCSSAYTTLTIPVSRMLHGNMDGHLLVRGPKNASTISTIATGYMAFSTGSDTVSIRFSPALDITRLTAANTNTHTLYPITGIMVVKYWLQQLKSPTHVLKHAMRKITPRIIIPAFPNRLPAT